MNALRRAVGGFFVARNYIAGTPFLLILSVLIGAAGGFVAIGFRSLIALFHDVFFETIAGELGHPLLFPLVPAFGMFLVGLVLKFAREAEGPGIPEVMAAVVKEGGVIRPRVIGVKAIASALCLSSGGSVGREGPIIQIGSALASTLGQVFGVSRERLKILVGCGAAAGISATFNTPIAGGLFALEVILGDFTVNTFTPIVLSAVIATAISRHWLGDQPAFSIPPYEMISLWELAYYSGLAVVVGLLCVAFIKVVPAVETLFERLRIRQPHRRPLAGFLVGVIGIGYPEVFESGYETVSNTLHDPPVTTFLIALLVFKLIATALTIGGGGSGGVFAPTLFLGAMTGGAYGQAIHYLWPSTSAGAGAYALVGMGAFVAGTAHTPLTGLVMLFELTDSYQIILPLMLATIISVITAKHFEPESIYTIRLKRRGLRIVHGVDMSILDSIPVRDAMATNFDYVRVQTPLGEIVSLLQHSELTDFPVVDDNSTLKGVVSFHDIRSVMMDNDLYPLLIAADVIGPDPPAVEENASLSEALSVFASSDITNLPVISGGSDSKLVGVISQSRLMSHYHQELQRRMNQ